MNEYSIRRGDKAYGPFSKEKLVLLGEEGKIFLGDQVTLDRGLSWQPIQSLDFVKLSLRKTTGTAQPAPPQKKTASAAIWKIKVDGELYGPYTVEQLRKFVKEGRVVHDTVITNGKAQKLAVDIPGLGVKKPARKLPPMPSSDPFGVDMQPAYQHPQTSAYTAPQQQSVVHHHYQDRAKDEVNKPALRTANKWFTIAVSVWIGVSFITGISAGLAGAFGPPDLAGALFTVGLLVMTAVYLPVWIMGLITAIYSFRGAMCVLYFMLCMFLLFVPVVNLIMMIVIIIVARSRSEDE